MAIDTQLFGLALAGGRSRRMGRDKATLLLRGHLAVDRCIQQLKPVCERVFVSLREEQESPATLASEVIQDRFGEIGPLGGLLSAFYWHRHVDWLVMSCALPFVSVKDLKQLKAASNQNFLATAFVGSNGEPIPLCTIFHHSQKDNVLRLAKQGYRKIEDVLAAGDINFIQADDPTIFDSIVTNDDYLEAQKRLMGV